jgi:hypothetical protein
LWTNLPCKYPWQTEAILPTFCKSSPALVLQVKNEAKGSPGEENSLKFAESFRRNHNPNLNQTKAS